jgi:hypothetical protein
MWGLCGGLASEGVGKSRKGPRRTEEMEMGSEKKGGARR